METKYKAIGSWWIFMLISTIDKISVGSVEGLRYLDKNNFVPKPKGTIKTIEVPEDGDIIDCVDFYKQPAFNNPLIKSSKLSKMPSSSYMHLFNITNNYQPKLIQNWHKYGECPEGTVPIIRKNKGSIFRKRPNYNPPSTREYAAAFQTGSIYHGAAATFNVWNPQVTGRSEFSLSQLWVTSGGDGTPLNTIETGWIVYPHGYNGSRQTRFFTYWTADGYEDTGCYDLDCEAFVQTDNRIPLGGAIAAISVYGGQTSIVNITIYRDRETRYWWLKFNNIKIGYYPGALFPSLGDGADWVGFGGEIVNFRAGNRHTSTQMGSGHFAQEWHKKASFIRNIQILNDRYEVVDASLTTDITKPECYNLIFGPPETRWKSHFFFGGPGYSPHCP